MDYDTTRRELEPNTARSSKPAALSVSLSLAIILSLSLPLAEAYHTEMNNI